jgi:putative membrane protein
MRYPLLSLVAVTAIVTSAGAASAANDKPFLKKAMEGDNSEMRLGAIAEQKGASSGVRDFGRMLNTDHAKALAEVTPVAKAHGMAPGKEMAPEAKTEATKLGHLSGAAFDREFAGYMVKDHKKDIAEFEKQARVGDASTAALARKTLPTLRKHLETAEQLAR